MAAGPTQPAEVGANYYDDANRTAGEEISSTGEGRHVYVQEAVLIHATTCLLYTSPSPRDS